MDDLVLKIEDVGKDYMLGAVTGQTFKDAIRKKNKSTNDVFNKKFIEFTFIPDHPQSTEKILLPDIFSLRHHDMISLPTVANAEVFVYALLS